MASDFNQRVVSVGLVDIQREQGSAILHSPLADLQWKFHWHSEVGVFFL